MDWIIYSGFIVNQIKRFVLSGAVLVALVVWITSVSAGNENTDQYTQARTSLIQEIKADVERTSIYLNKEKLDPRVLGALQKVPRHEFVPPEMKIHAYENRPLPIGYGQTISQPYIVAIMTDLIEVQDHHRVLEIGTGSGYQAAILSELAQEVYTIEIIDELGQQAKTRMHTLGYDNVHTRIADGYYGWPEAAPFDAIIVTAVASHVPPPLIQQLKPMGKMILPLGSRFLTQQLVVVSKAADGKLSTRQILPVRFVPLTGGH